MPPPVEPDADLQRMRADHAAAIQRQLQDRGIAGVALLTTGNVYYATGAEAMAADSARMRQQRMVAVVVAGDPLPHLFTHYPEGAPPELDDTHLHRPLYLESDEGVREARRAIDEVLGGVEGDLGFDELTAPMYQTVSDKLGRNVVAIDAMMTELRLRKTDDEVAVMRRAWQLTEAATAAAERAVRPGVRMSELSGAYLRHLFELGMTCNFLDPIFQAMPERIADGPWSTNGDVPFALVTNDHIASQGDVIWTDTVSGLHGYASDVGRTWVVGRPTPPMRDLYTRWREITDAVIGALKPGATGADLTRVACEANGGTRPWLEHYFLAHGLGLEGGEFPQIGSDRGEAFDEQFVFEPGMAIVVEPITWADGHGGYRCEELVLVTEQGHEVLSAYPNEPFE